MEKIFDTFKPDGFGNVAPYIIAANPEELIKFLKNAFFARELNRSTNPETGHIANCILKIGDTCIMITQARDEFPNSNAAFYLYVDDVDELHKRAIQHGATPLFEPADMPYEDRQSGILDTSGNYWWISKRLKNKGYEE